MKGRGEKGIGRNEEAEHITRKEEERVKEGRDRLGEKRQEEKAR